MLHYLILGATVVCQRDRPRLLFVPAKPSDLQRFLETAKEFVTKSFSKRKFWRLECPWVLAWISSFTLTSVWAMFTPIFLKSATVYSTGTPLSTTELLIYPSPSGNLLKIGAANVTIRLDLMICRHIARTRSKYYGLYSAMLRCCWRWRNSRFWC